MIRVLICDDQDVVREGLRAILSVAPGMQVVGVASDGPAALEALDAARHGALPDVVLMDLNMPGMTGIQATRLIREHHPSVRVLALTTYDADEWVFDAIRAGAAGYVLKDTPRAGLIKAIEGTASGQTFVDPNVAGKLFSHIAHNTVTTDSALADALNERERDVLRLLSRGLTNNEIAKQLFLSEGTVRNYVTAIFTKLNVSDRTQAAVIALRHGLVE
jgi:DNA-binding NarL/FixJ family response regulator